MSERLCTCIVCGAQYPFNPFACKRKTCSEVCSKKRTRKREFDRWQREKGTPLRNKKKGRILQHKDSVDLPPPTRAQAERMMDGLHRLLLTTGDEVSLLFGQAQGLGRGIRYKGTEAHI